MRVGVEVEVLAMERVWDDAWDVTEAETEVALEWEVLL